MHSSNHHLSLYTKLITVLNKEDWQSMKIKSRRINRMIRMGVTGHVRGNRTETDE